MVALTAAAGRPQLLANLVLVAPSPRLVAIQDHVGAFYPRDIDDLLGPLDSDHPDWTAGAREMLDRVFIPGQHEQGSGTGVASTHVPQHPLDPPRETRTYLQLGAASRTPRDAARAIARYLSGE